MPFSYRFLWLLFPSLVWLNSCSDQDDLFSLSLDQNKNLPVVATVGKQVILDSEVDAELQYMPSSLQQQSQMPEIRHRVEEILIRRAVLSQQAVAQGLDLEPDVATSIHEARDNILIDALKSRHLNQMSVPDQAALKTYYDSHRDDFAIPEQIHAAHILLLNKKEADRVYDLLKHKPALFSKLAIKESLDDSNNTRGGDLNWFPRGVMAEAFEQVAFAMKDKGQISKPVQTKSGWHIIVLKGRKAGRMQSFADAQEEIVHVLQHQALEQWINKLVAQANVHRKKKPAFNDPIELPHGLHTPLSNLQKSSVSKGTVNSEREVTMDKYAKTAPMHDDYSSASPLGNAH
ncbi:MAG: peptidylprolyl isomerase [Mariprofundaceae bacterium]|nr:peptidylprolyl isomerase [Mariprofundaceae bacterium]